MRSTVKSSRIKVYPIEQFKSFADAERDIDEWVKTFPERYDVIIGIPRSGLYVASYIAIKLGVPLSTPDNFLRNEIWFSNLYVAPKIRKVLLVDDGVGRVNGQMSKVFSRLAAAFPDISITKAALYGYPDAVQAVDLHFGFLNANKWNREEWNIMHHKHGLTACDHDGVLSHDWDPNRYKSYDDFIENAEPYLIPRFKMDFIITSREERFREATLKWYRRNEVNFGKLIMLKGQNTSAAVSVEHKVHHLKQHRPTWFWESNIVEAEAIHRLTGIPVLCTDRMVMLA